MGATYPETIAVPGLVSVVIATYNRADLLPDAVRSCLGQTYKDVEVIIVDDGSTDDTEDVVRALVEGEWSDSRISFWRTANRGPSAARQFGQDRATGEFVQFLDSDDCLMPKKFELQVAAMRSGNPPAQACVCFGRKGSIQSGWSQGERIGASARDVEGYVRALSSPQSHAMASCAPLWRRELLRAQPGWPLELRFGEDWCYYTRLVLAANRIASVDDELFWARDHVGSRLTNGEHGATNTGRAQAFASALGKVTEMIRATPYYDAECRHGLLKIARSAYLLLLESGEKEDIRRFEGFVTKLADGIGARSLWAALINSRRLLGSRVTLALARTHTNLRAALR